MKIFKHIIYSILLFILLYILTAYILTLFPYKIKNQNHKNKIIYLYYTNMHTGIMIDSKESNYNWKKLLPHLLKDRQNGYLLFGFGDRDTYISTPSWSDLKLYTALKALFINTPSLIHISYYKRINPNSKYLIKLKIDSNQYKFIEKEILESFGKEPTFAHKGYRDNDIFYNSPYKYNLFYTCNNWSGDILREANITMSYWTPFSWSVIKPLMRK